MVYRLALSEAAREQLKALPKTTRRRIGLSMAQGSETDLAGDVKKLTARDEESLVCEWGPIASSLVGPR